MLPCRSSSQSRSLRLTTPDPVSFTANIEGKDDGEEEEEPEEERYVELDHPKATIESRE